MSAPTDNPSASEPRRTLLAQAVNLPNIITYLRILAIPAVLVFMANDSQRNAFIAAMIFTTASVSDVLDGYLARKYNLTSILGKFLDPMADKLLVMGVLLMLLHLGRVSVWVVLVILSREMIITGLRQVAAGEGLVIAARDLGKRKTAFQMTGLFGMIIHYAYPLEWFGPEPLSFAKMGLVFLYISLFYSIVSAYDYFREFFRVVTRQGRL